MAKQTINTIKKRHRNHNKIYSDYPISPLLQNQIEKISMTLLKKVDKEILDKKLAPAKEVLKIIGAGVLLGSALAVPALPKILLPFLRDTNENETWKQLNIPYLKRTLKRLEKQKLVEFGEENGKKTVKITSAGQRKILKYALNEITIDKPKIWDGRWYLVSYDIPTYLEGSRILFRDYLKQWNFYHLHESVYLHAYPCTGEIEFLREYLNISSCVRIFTVQKIENDQLFRDYFGLS